MFNSAIMAIMEGLLLSLAIGFYAAGAIAAFPTIHDEVERNEHIANNDDTFFNWPNIVSFGITITPLWTAIVCPPLFARLRTALASRVLR